MPRAIPLSNYTPEKMRATRVFKLDAAPKSSPIDMTSQPIPRHWLNIADSVRNIGNVPGAHPRAIPGYRFSKQDAELAYTNTSGFVAAYFEKIAPLSV
jgi:hypothetical protein